MMGGAVGLAVLAQVAAGRTGGSHAAAALNDGYHLAFVVAAIFAVVAAVVGWTQLRSAREPAPTAEAEPVAS
jgi:membrane protein implicated in regulation of membrane protease activity